MLGFFSVDSASVFPWVFHPGLNIAQVKRLSYRLTLIGELSRRWKRSVMDTTIDFLSRYAA